MQNTDDVDATHSRRLLRSLLLDCLIVIVLLIPIIICEFLIEPFRRGFFCNDTTIQHPYRPSTIPELMLGLPLGILPIMLLIVVEFARFYHAGEFDCMPLLLWQWRVPTWLLETSKQVAYFIIGLLLTFDATEVCKCAINRLRPHFIAVCQPQLLDGSTCDNDLKMHGRYIDNYICAASGYTARNVRQARLSFPSAHSSLIFFGMVYLTLYLQRRMNWRGSLLARHFLQFVLLMLAWFVASSRIMDNWHHWSDVVVGSLMGVVIALLNAIYIAKLFKSPTFNVQKPQMKLQLPPQPDTGMQQDLTVTPPTYSLNSLQAFESLQARQSLPELESLHSGYSNEQNASNT